MAEGDDGATSPLTTDEKADSRFEALALRQIEAAEGNSLAGLATRLLDPDRLPKVLLAALVFWALLFITAWASSCLPPVRVAGLDFGATTMRTRGTIRDLKQRVDDQEARLRTLERSSSIANDTSCDPGAVFSNGNQLRFHSAHTKGLLVRAVLIDHREKSGRMVSVSFELLQDRVKQTVTLRVSDAAKTHEWHGGDDWHEVPGTGLLLTARHVTHQHGRSRREVSEPWLFTMPMKNKVEAALPCAGVELVFEWKCPSLR